MTKTDTAHMTWNVTWQDEKGRAPWLTPEADVMETISSLAEKGAPVAALDLGAGVGRHALAMARAGFAATALDASPEGLNRCRAAAQEEGLTVETVEGMMNELPFPDAAFDYVLSFNVIYHGSPDIIRATLDEIRRVTRPGGIFQGTMLSKRNGGYGRGQEIAPGTFVVPDATDDKIHPHFYCNAGELVALLQGFELRFLKDVEHKSPGSGSWHWHFIAERL